MPFYDSHARDRNRYFRRGSTGQRLGGSFRLRGLTVDCGFIFFRFQFGPDGYTRWRDYCYRTRAGARESNRLRRVTTLFQPGAAEDADRALETTGHTLETLLLYLPDDELDNPRLLAAARFLTQLMWDQRVRDWEIGPRGTPSTRWPFMTSVSSAASRANAGPNWPALDPNRRY